MRKITPLLWFDQQAKQAAEFYCSVFANSKITSVNTIHDTPTPTGDCDILAFELAGHPFMAINAGPLFKFNPSVSFIVHFDPSKDSSALEHLDAAWSKLSQGGTPLMPLDKYPFSERYGWIQDKYGLSWQLMLTNPRGDERPFITPSLMFTGNAAGRAEEAIDFYCSVFKDGKRGTTARYPKGMEPDREGTFTWPDDVTAVETKPQHWAEKIKRLLAAA